MSCMVDERSKISQSLECSHSSKLKATRSMFLYVRINYSLYMNYTLAEYFSTLVIQFAIAFPGLMAWQLQTVMLLCKMQFSPSGMC